ncbi:Uncharacterised protein [Segatella copri]|nr:Uncharacterised protein [Segatella copri]
MGTLRACAGRLRLNLGLGLYHRLHDRLLVVAIDDLFPCCRYMGFLPLLVRQID